VRAAKKRQSTAKRTSNICFVRSGHSSVGVTSSRTSWAFVDTTRNRANKVKICFFMFQISASKLIESLFHCQFAKDYSSVFFRAKASFCYEIKDIAREKRIKF
jgi:hypothetical protein